LPCGDRLAILRPMLSAGDTAPDCVLRDPEGKPWHLAQAWAAGPALVVFYPGDDTPVCTAQLCEYRDRWAEFSSRGVTVVGINPASVERHAGFAGKHRFPFPLLSDPGNLATRAFGAKAWYGTRRRCVLVGKDGLVHAVVDALPFLKPKLARLIAAIDALPPGSGAYPARRISVRTPAD
jgi:peroxiredoxin Q/BCP